MVVRCLRLCNSAAVVVVIVVVVVVVVVFFDGDQEIDRTEGERGVISEGYK